MSYLTTQYSMHENLLWVFFSNATLEDADQHDEDLCHIVAMNTFVMGVPIRVTQRVVAETVAMPGNSFGDEHIGFPLSMLIPNEMLWTSCSMRDSYICLSFISFNL